MEQSCLKYSAEREAPLVFPHFDVDIAVMAFQPLISCYKQRGFKDVDIVVVRPI